jgi:hypothetical protein
LLRRERNSKEAAIDHERYYQTLDPDNLELPWLDRNALIGEMILKLAALNAAIARRVS